MRRKKNSTGAYSWIRLVNSGSTSLTADSWSSRYGVCCPRSSRAQGWLDPLFWEQTHPWECRTVMAQVEADAAQGKGVFREPWTNVVPWKALRVASGPSNSFDRLLLSTYYILGSARSWLERWKIYELVFKDCRDRSHAITMQCEWVQGVWE